MDIQYAVAMAYNLSVQYIAVGGEYHDFIPDLECDANDNLSPTSANVETASRTPKNNG